MKQIPFFLLVLAIAIGVTGVSAKTQTESTTPQQVFDGMRQNFVANRSLGFHARYQFDLSGPNGGLWWIEVNDGKCKFGRGKIQDPGITFITSDRDWVALSNGTLLGPWAFLTGRLKVRGDQKLAKKLDEIFNP